jgi:hypothetical protein
MINRIIQKLFRPKFISNYKRYCAGPKQGHALLYYKTDAFVFKSLAKNYKHTNFWEVIEMAKILNKLGFWVDVADRTITLNEIKNIKDKYDIFIGIGAGDSGKYYPEISKRVPSAVRVFYALGPEPTLSNELQKKQYDYFIKRHPESKFEMRRMIHHVDMVESMKHTDAILTNGNNFVQDGYKKFNKKIYRIWLSSHPNLKSDVRQLTSRSQTKFLYFGGNGNIIKGLDLTVEAFSGLPNLELYICAPRDEDEFNVVYDPIFQKVKNIHHLGFIQVAGNLYNEIMGKCGYIIFPSSSESVATSVTTCMRSGLVPVVTKETGIDLGDFGHLINNIEIDKLRQQIIEISKEPRDDFVSRSLSTYIESFKYTQDNFSVTFEKAALEILNDFKKLSKY